MLKLGRMRIDNFKSFIEPISFDFSGADIVLFDGPNGFGKTTIFDAIELCFTGEIHRIKASNSKRKNDHILKGDNTRSTSIKLEIVGDGETILVIEVFIPAGISGVDGKVANYKNTVKRLESFEWTNELPSNLRKNELDANKLRNLLSNNELDSTFTIFNYIQQEETCHFLKLEETQRHKKISHLFGTTNEKEKSNKLDSLSAKLFEEINSYKSLIKKHSDELTLLSKPSLDKEDNDENFGSKKIAILSNLSNNTTQQIEAYKANLEGTDWILKNYTLFQEQKFNYQLNVLANNRKDEISNFIKIGSIDSYEKIKKLQNQYASWKKACRKATVYNSLIEKFDSKPNTLTKEILDEYKLTFTEEYNKRNHSRGAYADKAC